MYLGGASGCKGGEETPTNPYAPFKTTITRRVVASQGVIKTRSGLCFEKIFVNLSIS